MPAVPSPAYRGFFPEGVVTAEMRAPGDPGTLSAEDRARLARAVPKRLQEFAAGRQCARVALERLGLARATVGTATDRQPVWPATVVGSITHTDGFCAAAVARGGMAALGIDTEVVERATERLIRRICVAAEAAWIGSLPAAERAAALMLVFSAKEAFFKCQYPLVGEWLDFRDVCVEPAVWRPAAEEDPAVIRIQGTRPLAVSAVTTLPVQGHYRFHEQFVSTGVAFNTPCRPGTP